MADSEKFFLDGPAGKLQAVLDYPEADETPDAVALVLHPHPQHEGTMHNKVAYMLARSFTQWGAPALRINFRGVGESEGEYGDAIGETDDALAALDWLHNRWPNADLCMAGFSFGAQVALRAAVARNIKQLITVAPPVGRFKDQDLSLPQCSWLLIQGDADDVVDPDEVISWAKALPEPPQLEILKGAGHFFHGRLNDLRDTVLEFLPH